MPQHDGPTIPASAARLDAAYLQLVKMPEIYGENLEKSIGVILRHCAHSLQVQRASLWLLSAAKTELECLSLYRDDQDAFESGALLTGAAFPAYFDALLESRLVDAVDASNDPRTSELGPSYLSVLDVRSLLDATIRDPRSDGHFQGVLCTEAVGEQRDWSNDEKSFVASIADLLSQRLVPTELVRSEAKHRALYNTTSQATLLFNKTTFTDVNQAACDMFAADRHDLIEKRPIELSPAHQPDGQPSAVKAAMYVQGCLAGTSQHFEWVCTRVDGTDFDAEITLHQVKIGGNDTFFALIRDITDRKATERAAVLAQRKLEYRAAHDSLTGLLNREQLHIHINRLITNSQDPSQQVALMLFDLNRFKEINDTLGHSTGDSVLIQVSELLNSQVVSSGGTLFRLGGDEFVAVFESPVGCAEFEKLVTVLKETLDTTIVIEDVAFQMSASVGAAVFPQNGDDSHDLLRCADVAMYHAKNNEGASPWYALSNDLHDRRRLSMVADLQRAIRDDELVLHFQPRIHISTGRVTGCEALVRWQHPQCGLLPPADFLPLAERSELIHPLAIWVVNDAFAEIKRLRSRGFDVPVAVNLSARNLPDAQLFDLIETLLVRDAIDPHLLEIEITESALIKNPQRALKNLQRLEKLGVSIAIDDFGTGYSSLSLLKELPLDTLKIDRSFVNDLLSNGSDEVIVSSTVSLAHNFSATVVAEGVEDQATLDALEALNCDQAQGFFIAKPMPADDFERWLDAHHRIGHHSSVLASR